MSRSATAWLKDGGIYFGSEISYEEGGGRIVGPFFRGEASDSPDALGRVVLEALAESKTSDYVDSTPWRDVIKPLLKLAKLKSWKSFISEAKLVNIREDKPGTIQFFPSTTNGKGTFGLPPEWAITATSSDPSVLGETLISVFEKCTVDTNPRNWRDGYFNPD